MKVALAVGEGVSVGVKVAVAVGEGVSVGMKVAASCWRRGISWSEGCSGCRRESIGGREGSVAVGEGVSVGVKVAVAVGEGDRWA